MEPCGGGNSRTNLWPAEPAARGHHRSHQLGPGALRAELVGKRAHALHQLLAGLAHSDACRLCRERRGQGQG